MIFSLGSGRLQAAEHGGRAEAEMVEQGDHPAHPDHRQQGTQADAHRPAHGQQADGGGQGHVAQVEAVLAQAHAPARPVGDGLDDAVAGVGDQAHVQGQGSPHAGAHDGPQQKEDLPGQGPPKAPLALGGQVGDAPAEPVEEPGKDQAQGKLQGVQQQGGPQRPAERSFALPGPQPVQDHLRRHKGGVEQQGGVAKVVPPDGGDTVGDRDDGGDPQPGLGVHGDAQGQDQQPGQVKQAPKEGFGRKGSVGQGIVFFLLIVFSEWPARCL